MRLVLPLRVHSLNLERCILYLVVTSFILWIFLGVYFLSSFSGSKEPVFHSGHGTWRLFRGDNPNLLLKNQPPLLFEKLVSKDGDSLRKDRVVKEEFKNGGTTKHESAFEKLKKIHGNKLSQAGFKVGLGDTENNLFVLKSNFSMKQKLVLSKVQKIHREKLNRAGFNIAVDGTGNDVSVKNMNKLNKISLPKASETNYNVHIFYYPWFGNPETDGKYIHWNHHYIPHWIRQESIKWPLGVHKPPDDIGANFYPALGPYSSSDPAVVDAHMAQIQSTGAGVVGVSWYPPDDADTEGMPPDKLMPLILNTAEKYKLKVFCHIEPYKNRNHVTMRKNIRYITETYGNHPAFYHRVHKGRNLPVHYIYDSYTVIADDWAKLFKDNGEMTVRNTDIDGIFIGLLVEKKHENELFQAGFDGFYTYFASNGFTYGSTWRNWPSIAAFAKAKNMIFIPSVGPGYVDTRVRPWNGANTKQRDHGIYYEAAFKSAVALQPPIVSITSFNEWHEGTQIETAVAKQTDKYVYEDYQPEGEVFYLNLTKKWVNEYSRLNLVGS